MKRLVVVALLGLTVGGVALADNSARDQAKEIYERATVHFRLGQFADAAAEYQRVYELHHDSALLYNIAQSYRLANDPEKALFFYRSFLSTVPDAANRSEVEGRIAELERIVTEQRRAKERPPNGVAPAQAQRSEAPAINRVTPVPTEPAVTPAPLQPSDYAAASTGRKKLIAGGVVAGAGVALIAGGIVCGVLAQKNSNDITHAALTQQSFDYSQYQSGKTDQTLEVAFIAVGGAALVVGTTVMILGKRQESRAHVWLRPILGRQTAGVALGRVF